MLRLISALAVLALPLAALAAPAKPEAAPAPASPTTAAAGTPAAFTTPTLQRVRETGVIRLAHRESSIPFSYLDSNKKPVGYALDICLMVVDALRRDLKLPKLQVEYVPVTSANRIAAIVNGQADLECGSTTNNLERRKQAAFTHPHYFAGARLLVAAGSPIKRLADLRGKRIVTTKGTTIATTLKAQGEKGLIAATIIEAKDHGEAFATLERGDADAFAMDDVLLYSLRAASKDPKNWELVGEFISIEPLAIMLRRDDPDFKKYVDVVVAHAMLDGLVRKAYGKWFLAPIPPTNANLAIPMSPMLREQMLYPNDKVGDEIGS